MVRESLFKMSQLGENHVNRRIVFTSNTSFNIYNFRYGLLKALKDLGYDIIALVPEDEYSDLLEREFNLYRIKNLRRRGKNPLKEFFLILEYLNYYKRLDPQKVISFTVKPNIYSSLVCMILNTECYCVITGLGFLFIRKDFFSKVVQYLYKMAFRGSKNIIFQNQDDMEEFIRRGIIKEKKAKVIMSSGVDTAYFSKCHCKDKEENDKIVFLMVARILWDKGIKEYVEAIKLLKEKREDFEAWLLGGVDTDNPSCVSREKLDDWEAQGLIKYLGHAKDVRPYLCQADCVVLPSYREGVPRSLLEAMAMGKPIITTNTAGCKDVVEDFKNGFLVKPKDIDSLYAAMGRFLELAVDERESMGKYGRQKVIKKFGEKVIIARYLEVLNY